MLRIPLMIALLSLTGCSALYVDAEVKQLCQHLPKQSFQVPKRSPGAPRDLSISRDFAFDLSVQVPAVKNLDQHVKFSSITITAADPTKDLGFVDAASVILRSPAGSSLQPVFLAYGKTEAAPVSITVAKEGLELAPYLSAGTLTYAVTLDGTIPSEDVSVTIDACATAELRFDFGP